MFAVALTFLLACADPPPPAEAPAPLPTVAERMAATEALARRLHAENKASKVYGTYLAHGADSYPAVLDGMKPLFGGDLDAVAFSVEDGRSLVARAGERRWSLALDPQASFLDPHLLGLLNRILADTGSARQVVLTYGGRDQVYYLVARRESVAGWRAEGLLLGDGLPTYVVEEGPASVALSGTPLAVSLAAPGLGPAVRELGRLQVPGFGTFSLREERLAFRPDRELQALVAGGETRAGPYPVRVERLGAISADEAGVLFTAVANAVSAGAGAAAVEGLCTFRRVDRPPRVETVEGEPVIVEASATLTAECP